MGQGREGSFWGCGNEHVNSVGTWGSIPLRTSGDGLKQASELSHWRGKELVVPQLPTNSCLSLVEACSQVLNSPALPACSMQGVKHFSAAGKALSRVAGSFNGSHPANMPKGICVGQ